MAGLHESIAFQPSGSGFLGDGSILLDLGFRGLVLHGFKVYRLAGCKGQIRKCLFKATVPLQLQVLASEPRPIQALRPEP